MEPMKLALRSGYAPFRTTDGEETEQGRRWWVFPAKWTDDQILEALDRAGFDVRGYYGGPGRQFAHTAYVKRAGKTRALALQTVGLDV